MFSSKKVYQNVFWHLYTETANDKEGIMNLEQEINKVVEAAKDGVCSTLVDLIRDVTVLEIAHKMNNTIQDFRDEPRKVIESKEALEVEARFVRFLRKLKKGIDKDWMPDVKEGFDDFVEKEGLHIWDSKYDKRKRV